MIDPKIGYEGEISEEEVRILQSALSRKRAFDDVRANAFNDIRIHESVTGFPECPEDCVPIEYNLGGEIRRSFMKRELANRLGLTKKWDSFVEEVCSRLRAVTLTEEEASRLHKAIDCRTRPQPDKVTPTLPQCIEYVSVPLSALREMSVDTARMVRGLASERNISCLYGMQPKDVMAVAPVIADVLAGLGTARSDAPNKPDLCGNG